MHGENFKSLATLTCTDFLSLRPEKVIEKKKLDKCKYHSIFSKTMVPFILSVSAVRFNLSHH